jgi:hypothetical protein
MTSDPSTKFDEPALKAAVCRAWAGEAAPVELRRQIESLVSERPVGETEAASSLPDVIHVAAGFWRRALIGFAMGAAAILMIGLAVVVFQMSRSEQPKTTAEGGSAAGPALPAELGNQLVARHDSCTHAPDHHFFTAAPRDNFKAIAQGMSTELHHPVLAAAIGSDWEFRGAGKCPVGSTPSAHLVYAQGDAFVSVFSLPASRFPTCPNHENCEADLNGHAIAGFREGESFYAVVGSGKGRTPIDLKQVTALRNRLRVEAVVLANHNTPLIAMGTRGNDRGNDE